MSTTTFSAESLADCIEPSSVSGSATELFDGSDETALYEACRLHRFCLERISYEKYEDLRSANKVLESRRGDCTDQTVLLSSLLLSREIPVRIVQVQDHLFPEALVPLEPGQRVDCTVQKFYSLGEEEKVGASGDPNTHSNLDDPGYWYPVDSVMSRYLGDLGIHAEEQLIIEKNGEWQWEGVQLCKICEP